MKTIEKKDISFLHVDKDKDVPLYQQLRSSILDAIGDGKLVLGEPLPSLNRVRTELKVSINTVVKAYDELKQQGVIESSFGKGFYVATESVEHEFRVFFLMDEMNFFKGELYRAFKNKFSEDAKIDVYFYHFNPAIYELLIRDNIGRYNQYVILPYEHPKNEELLSLVDPKQLLILDRNHGIDPSYSHICQDFEADTLDSLRVGRDRISRYKRFNLICPIGEEKKSCLPFTRLIQRGFKRFCKEAEMDGVIIRERPEARPRQGEAYLIISEDCLVAFIKRCQSENLVVGQDVGVISYNDSPFKEIIEGGITCISTDFKAMGQTAADSILSSDRPHLRNPATLIIRKSL